MNEILLIIIIAFLSFVLFIAISKLVSKISEDGKDYYFKKVQDLDQKISEKQDELNNLEKPNENQIKEEKRVIEKRIIDKDLLNILNNTEYQNDDFMVMSKKVDEIFDINEEKIIKNFVSKIKIDENYKYFQSIRDKFSPNYIYKLKNINKESQIKEIKKILDDDETRIFNEYLASHKYNLNRMLLDFDFMIDKSSPLIEIYVGVKNKNFDYISPYIKTIYSDDILKGILIKYHGQIYDYSIDERDV